MNESFYYELLQASEVPAHLHHGIVMYLVYGLPPGSFLFAVLQNDLYGAVNRADEASADGLVPLVRWLYNAAPAVAWGSKTRTVEWMQEAQSRQKVSA